MKLTKTAFVSAAVVVAIVALSPGWKLGPGRSSG